MSSKQASTQEGDGNESITVTTREMPFAFVTGGSKGIGRAIVLRFIQQGVPCVFTFCSDIAGADETIRLAHALNGGVSVSACELDVASRESLEPVLDRVIEKHGQFSVVVNNAGILQTGAAVLLGDEEWDRVIATNLSGPFFVLRYFLGHFLSNRKGG